MVPILTLGEDLQVLKSGAQDDPVTEAAKKGLKPTLRDVKKSVKVHHIFISSEAKLCRPCLRPSSTS
jgi:hypothetical protein